MNFQFLPALLAFPLFLLLNFLLSRNRKVISQTYSGPFSFHSISGSPGFRIAVLLQYSGIALLCIAMARPQEGFEMNAEAGGGVENIIKLDV